MMTDVVLLHSITHTIITATENTGNQEHKKNKKRANTFCYQITMLVFLEKELLKIVYK